jgi:hypothetical protein
MSEKKNKDLSKDSSSSSSSVGPSIGGFGFSPIFSQPMLSPDLDDVRVQNKMRF